MQSERTNRQIRTREDFVRPYEAERDGFSPSDQLRLIRCRLTFVGPLWHLDFLV